ncbi:hypothetical protein TUSST3_18550 [Streptomyces sp. TUS-ST3]|nr:hypothetical protein TUSST3_18550 [Streptomyces sp. TUS-ST3]
MLSAIWEMVRGCGLSGCTSKYFAIRRAYAPGCDDRRKAVLGAIGYIGYIGDSADIGARRRRGPGGTPARRAPVRRSTAMSARHTSSCTPSPHADRVRPGVRPPHVR